jgi:hypothetical protein
MTLPIARMVRSDERDNTMLFFRTTAMKSGDSVDPSPRIASATGLLLVLLAAAMPST